jgi:hypothetical protein
MSYTLLGKIKRAVRKPPSYIVKRLWMELERKVERHQAPRRASSYKIDRLFQALSCPDIESCWQHLVKQPFFANTEIRNKQILDAHIPGEAERVLKLAKQAHAHQVDLLGSGLIDLGDSIDWHQDYKTKHRWPPQYCHNIEYNNLDKPSDVKFPWEVSRMQWLLPLGQAYLLDQDDKHAEKVKTLIIDWIQENPYAMSVNWSCTMDVALRLMSWIWFFHVFHAAPSWQDREFQTLFLRHLYLHGDFTIRNLEESDVNGNHYTTDAAGLVFAGLFFTGDPQAATWLEKGWQLLEQEILLQTSSDGVDFEASVPYHRLVLELFLLPALYSQAHGKPPSSHYLNRLGKMAKYTQAYSRPDGSVPLLGDFDDGRALPFCLWPMNEHRYLLAMTAACTQPNKLSINSDIPLTELYWLFGETIFNQISQEPPLECQHSSFEPGYYIAKNQHDHLFIDCAEVGMRGKGGHGHNDCLHFSLMLNGQLLFIDRGAYLYTADAKARNDYRATHSHNTPQVDHTEINAFLGWDFLWNVKYEAKPQCLRWEQNGVHSHFTGSHSGYQKLQDPVSLKRSISLDHHLHQFTLCDHFTAKNNHDYNIPLWLAPETRVENVTSERCVLIRHNQRFALTWQGSCSWNLSIVETSCSETFGRERDSLKLVWHTRAQTAEFKLQLQPLP